LSHIAKFIATDSSFIILDIMSNLVHEFRNTGKYIQTFGRHGQGSGEYKRSNLIETDNTGNIVIFDQASMKLNVYKRNGAFIGDLNVNKKLSWSNGLKINKDGNLLQLISYNRIHQLRKYNSPDLNQVYSVSLSDEKTNAVVTHFGMHTGFTNDPENNRLYYINPCDFQIQEIDAKTDNIVKLFGIKPPNYRPLVENINQWERLEIRGSLLKS